MRILHFSDLHIGIENYGRPLAERDLASLPAWFAPGEDRQRFLGRSTRLIDFLSAFDELVAYAIDQRADLVLFSGDAYKSRDPSQTHQREFARRVSRLASAGVPVFLLAGNHDLPHTAYKATAIEIFETLAVPLVTVAERPGVYRVETRSGPLQVLALPWVRRSAFLGRDDVRNLPYKEIVARLEEKLVGILQAEAARLDAALPAVLSAHASLNTARLGSERTMMIADEHVLMQSSLTRLPVDYIALGHVHRRQELSQRPPTVYPGSLQRIDFGEEDHDAKGFYVVEIDPGKPPGARVTAATFQPVSARAFVTVAVTLKESDADPTATVIEAIARHPVADAIVRVQVKLPASLAGTHSAGALRERDIRQALDARGAHHVAAVTKEVERAARVRLGAFAGEPKSPQELLRFYLDTNNVPPDRAEKLLDYAHRLMAPESEEP